MIYELPWEKKRWYVCGDMQHKFPAPPPYGWTSRVWDSLLVRKSGCVEVVGSRPGRGNSKESFSSNQETGKVFLSWNALLFQILKYVVPVGKCKLQSICVPSYEASSHVKNYAYSGKLLNKKYTSRCVAFSKLGKSAIYPCFINVWDILTKVPAQVLKKTFIFNVRAKLPHMSALSEWLDVNNDLKKRWDKSCSKVMEIFHAIGLRKNYATYAYVWYW